MRVISISGTLGSGKTTVIKALAKRLCRSGKKVSIINNENGKNHYDDAFCNAYNIAVKHLRGG